MHLLRTDIVNRDDEDGLVALEQALELVEVGALCVRLAPHIFDETIGYLRTGSGVMLGI